MLVFKFIAYLFPFIKEMVLGDKTVQQALKTNKLKVLIIGAILLSFGLNFLLIPRLVALSFEHVELKRRYADLEATTKNTPPLTPGPDPKPSDPLPTPPPPELSAEQLRLKEFFDRIREEERRHR